MLCSTGVGRETIAKSYEDLATNGHLVSYGPVSGHIDPIDIGRYASKSATVSRPNLGHVTDTHEKVRAITTNLFLALRNGILKPVEPTALPLRNAGQAHRRLESRAGIGDGPLAKRGCLKLGSVSSVAGGASSIGRWSDDRPS